MGLQFFKPNKSNKGCLAHFTFSSKGDNKAVYLELIKQNGWDAQARGGQGNGIFKDGERTNVKFSIYEIGDILYCIRIRAGLNKPFYHKSDAGSSTINFGPYCGKVKDDKGNFVDSPTPTGFSVGVLKGESKFNIGFTFGEVELLRVWLENALVHISDGIYADDLKRHKEYQESKKNSDKPAQASEKPRKVEEFVEPQQEEEDIPF